MPVAGSMTGETGLVARLEEDLAEARAELAEVRQELADRREAQGKAEERAVVLREALDFERARTNRLEEEIRELRRPWWRRLLG
jgi:chromosome segregation ATPase